MKISEKKLRKIIKEELIKEAGSGFLVKQFIDSKQYQISFKKLSHELSVMAGDFFDLANNSGIDSRKAEAQWNVVVKKLFKRL